jgi:hypothetical protein
MPGLPWPGKGARASPSCRPDTGAAARYAPCSLFDRGRNPATDPPGACVVTDQVVLTLVANRFVSDIPGCPLLVVDSVGTDYALARPEPIDGRGEVPAAVAVWRNALRRAQYVWLSGRQLHRVPWTSGLLSYFHHHFTWIMSQGSASVGIDQRNALPSR